MKDIEQAAEKAIGIDKGKKKSSNEVNYNSKAPVVSSSIVDAGSQLQSASKRGTKGDSSYQQLSLVPIIDNIEDNAHSTIGNFIDNTSLAEVLICDSRPLPQVYKDLEAFISSVGVYILYLMYFTCWHS